MASEVFDRPAFGPDEVVGPNWDQCPEEWRRDPEPATEAVMQPRFIDRVRVPAAMVLSAAAGYPVERSA
jgi:hypothetical protein